MNAKQIKMQGGQALAEAAEKGKPIIAPAGEETAVDDTGEESMPATPLDASGLRPQRTPGAGFFLLLAAGAAFFFMTRKK